MSYARFAIYYLPPDGALAAFGTAWLGWDVAAARTTVSPDVPGLDDVTMTPRKYGFHGTLKPPFRLAEGNDADGLHAAVSEMAAGCAPAQCDGLELTRLGRFLALTPLGDTSEIARVAATCVSALDRFRAPPSEAELNRRRKAGLSERQEALLQRWGYPYVMDAFRFHMTLTGHVEEHERDRVEMALRRHFGALPEAGLTIDRLTLFVEREPGAPFEVHSVHAFEPQAARALA